MKKDFNQYISFFNRNYFLIRRINSLTNDEMIGLMAKGDIFLLLISLQISNNIKKSIQSNRLSCYDLYYSLTPPSSESPLGLKHAQTHTILCLIFIK
jgi:hypothetical protein